jgi:hypothetical protein
LPGILVPTLAARPGWATSTTCRPRPVPATAESFKLNVSVRAASSRVQPLSGSRTPPWNAAGGRTPALPQIETPCPRTHHHLEQLLGIPDATASPRRRVHLRRGRRHPDTPERHPRSVPPPHERGQGARHKYSRGCYRLGLRRRSSLVYAGRVASAGFAAPVVSGSLAGRRAAAGGVNGGRSPRRRLSTQAASGVITGGWPHTRRSR